MFSIQFRSVGSMRLVKSIWQPILLLFLFSLMLGANALAQEKPNPSEGSTASTVKVLPAKSRPPVVQNAITEEQSASRSLGELEGDADQILKRAEWFYKQRSSANGHIAAGARLKAFQHMQRMMVAEGKLVLSSDGTYAAITPQAGPSVGGPWSSLGPTPTTGGFFSPVSGRIEAIAVDPSDPTGNTVLIGGAMGGIWRSTDAGTTWTAVGDQNASLAMGSIAFAPSCTPSPGTCTVYAGTGEQASIGFDVYYGAGVLVSTDHGQTWKQTCTTPSSTCPFIGPFNDTLNFGFFNDGGARISNIAVNPSNPNLVLVGAQIASGGGLAGETSGGIYCSSDGGATWTSLLSGEAGSFVGFVSPTVAYAALGGPFGSAGGAANPNGVYKSINANATSCSGITFTLLTQQPTTQSMGRIDLGIAPSDPTGNTVYASIANGSDGSRMNLGVFVTTNGGTSWTQTTAPDICHFQCWYDNVVKVDPTNPNTVFLGGAAVSSETAFEWVMRSTDGGASWNSAVPTPTGPGDPSVPHVDEHGLAFFKATSGTFAGKVRLYLGNDGGLWRTDDAEAATMTWTNLNQGLTLTQFYPSLSVNPSSPTIAYGGAQDNGSQVLSQGNLNWTDNGHCGDGGQTAVDFQVPTSVYITCQFIRLFFSPTGGTDPASYIPIGFGIDPNGTDAVDFIPPIATDPSAPGRVYFGTDHLYQSSDNGNTFTAISGPLPTRVGDYLTAIGVSPNKPDVVYAGANGGGVFVTTNATSANPSFAQVGLNQLPLRNVTAIAVDPTDSTGGTAYAVFSGFAVSSAGDHFGHIFKTTTAGTTWTDVSCTNLTHCESPNASDLPNIPVNDLIIDPDLPATTLYAATDIGVFQGTCTGTTCTWNTLGTGLPNVAVLSLKLHEPSRTLIAGTHGRGAWSLLLANFTTTGPHISSLSPISAQAPAASAITLTVNGSGLTGGTVQWNVGTTTTPLTTTPGSDTLLTASLPTDLLASSGTAQVSVSVGAANSNPLTFSVLSGLPTISSVSPTNANVNSNPNGLPIIVTGTNFANSSQVMLNPDFFPGSGQTNGKLLIPTTFSDSQHLSATIPGSFLANFGSTNSVGVQTPPPGGGTTLTTRGVTLPTFTVVSPPPANDAFANAISITGNTFTDTKDSSAATTETADPAPFCSEGSTTNGRSNSIWYQFKPSTNGTASLDTSGSNFDTVLSIWTGSPGSFTAVACNNGIDDPGIVSVTQLQNVSMTGGTTYFIMLSSFGPRDPNPVALGGKSVLNFTFTPAPDFAIASTGATTQTVTAGQTANFTNAVSIAAQNGFASQVDLSCSLPPAASNTNCTVRPATLASGSGTASVSVTTMAHGIAPPLLPTGRLHLHPQWVPLFLLTFVLALVLLRFARTRRQRLAGALPFVLLVLIFVLQAIGCGGGSYTPLPPPPPTGTPAGTYAITVTGTASTNNGALTHTASLTLTVN
jgi:hypothetical protein